MDPSPFDDQRPPGVNRVKAQKPTATVKPVIKSVKPPTIKSNHGRWKEPTGQTYYNQHQRSMSSSSTQDELFDDKRNIGDIEMNYIKPDVTAQVLRQTSLTRSDLCLSPLRGINPQKSAGFRDFPQSQEKNPQRRSQQPLKDDENSAQRPAYRRSVPPETRRSQSVSDLTEVNRAVNHSPPGGAHEMYNTQRQGQVINQDNAIRLLENFVNKRRSLERKPPPGVNRTQSPPGVNQPHKQPLMHSKRNLVKK
jgi:hypothetical protein